MFAVIGIGGGELMLLLVIIPILLAIMAFWIWMLVDVILNKGVSDGEKIGWVLAIVFLHLIGSVLYFYWSAQGEINTTCLSQLAAVGADVRRL